MRSPTLKSICVEQISLDEFILEADSLERLHLKDCQLKLIKLVGKGTLKQLVIDYVTSNAVTSTHLDIGDNLLENLEVVDIYEFTIIWPQFYKMISRSSKLRRLRLWDVFFDDKNEIVDLETFSVCFPQLSHLSLWYVYLRDGVHYALPGSSHLENVIEMELGWTTINELFPDWVEGLVKRCPNLRKLVIHGQDMDSEETEECMRLTSLIKHLINDKYEHVEV
ncbi:F-box/LRR-repeat protein At1g67190-like [Vitis riparia]|uniref:F-box/LRR-repeat protein At1g67190-like n=1 Tax=Vitis riparia TaxID=96939 RepID=UPI00155AD599|nr:F-box/LRR-repeat protein At1g67190-like [Vitis riparia]